MVKKEFFILLLLAVLVFHRAVGQRGKLQIKGNISGLDVARLYLTISTDNVVVEDSIKVKKGKFNYTVLTDGFTAILFSPRFMANVGPRKFKRVTEGTFSIYGNPGDILKLTGEKLSYIIDYEVSGNPINEDFVLMAKAIAPYLDEKLVIDYNDILERYYAVDGAMFQTGTNSKEQQAEIDRLKNDFMSKNPHSYYTLYQMALSDDRAKLKTYYENIPTHYKKGYFGKLLEVRLASFDLNKKGAKAPEIITTDIYKQPFKLSNLLGKYVILDFWGTWCAPCIQGIPAMKKYYDQYRKRVEYVGIACNEKTGVEGVVQRVKKSKMNWIHLMNGTDLNNYSKMFGVTGYPTKIIIDPTGTVLGFFVGEGEHFYAFLDKLMAPK